LLSQPCLVPRLSAAEHDFATALLLSVGESAVGESAAKPDDALKLTALLQVRWAHIQEVILQPWRPDGNTAGELLPVLPPELVNELLATIADPQHTSPQQRERLARQLWRLRPWPRPCRHLVSVRPQPDPARES
jgi:hypothetical protein